MSERPLTPKQQRFVEEYLVDLNATAAAGRAGYRDPNIGRQLITKNNVAAAIAAAQEDRAARTGVTQDYVVRRLKVEAEFTGEGSSHSARVAALGWLGRHLVMFADRMKHEGGVTIQTLVGPAASEILGPPVDDRATPDETVSP